jgi:hypothetical protein
MNKYLLKIAGKLGAKLGMPPGQPVPAQTVQVLRQVGTPNEKKEATGIANLGARGGFNHPRPTSKIPQKLPKIKEV